MKDFIQGAKWTTLLLIPIFVIAYVLESLALKNIISFSPFNYDAVSMILLAIIVVAYLLPAIYWIKLQSWKKLMGSILGGGIVLGLLIMLGVFLSCAQGSCF